MNLLKGDFLEITDFEYGEAGGVKILADTCKVFKNCGVMFYKNGNVINFIKTAVEEVNLIQFRDIKEHYYIKSKGHSSSVYLKLNTKKRDLPTEGKKVIKKGDDSSRLFILFTNKEKEELDSLSGLYEFIEQEFEWDLLEMLNDTVAKIKKGEIEEYVLVEDLITLEQIKTESKEFKEEKEKRK